MINLIYLKIFVLFLLIPTLILTLIYSLIDWKIERKVNKCKGLFKILTLVEFIAIGKFYIESLLKFIF